jgi:Tol biopolymer transport system component
LAWVLGCGGVFAQTTEWISRNVNGGISDNWSVSPAITPDARYVAFASYATDIVSGDTNGVWDVFVRDRQTGTTQRVSVDSNGIEGNNDSFLTGSLALSADGRYVVFDSLASNLVPGDTNGWFDVFLRDRLMGTTERVSLDSAGMEADGPSEYGIAMSADGRYVAFTSFATNLVPGDTNGAHDVFVKDRQTGTTERVSVDSSGAEANGDSDFNSTLSISSDGRFVAFQSRASNLVSGDTNSAQDIFVRDRQAGTTERVSVATGGVQGDLASTHPAISGDGRYVAFVSDATNLVAGDTNSMPDAFVHDRQTGTTTRVSVNSSGIQAAQGGVGWPLGLSANGRYVVFTSDATNLFPGNPYHYGHAFRHDRETGITTQADIGSFGSNPDGGGYAGAISDDGLHVAFDSHATNLVAGDTDFNRDVYVHDFLPASVTAFCLGDGSGTACPCANSGRMQRGCETSTATGGAILQASGTTSLGSDTLQFACHGERAQALTVILQGTANQSPANYGDGLLCVAGSLKRLYVKQAQIGIVIAPFGSEPSVAARSAAMGDTIGSGETRYYQAYFRDPTPDFCPFPLGNTWNSSNAISATWDP